MARVLRVLVMFVVLGEVTGVWSQTAADDCVPGCADDAGGKSCPPTCPTCSCSLRAAPSVAPAIAVLATPLQATRTPRLSPTDVAPASPDPRELHVPRPVLA